MSKLLLICAGVPWFLGIGGGISTALADSEKASDRPVIAQMGPDGVQRAVMTVDSHSYSPAHLIVSVGKPVELTLKSVTFITPHNFILKSPEAGLDVNTDVGAGESVTVRFVPAQAGIFTFFCDKQLLFFRSHREKGMEGRLEVQE